MGCGGCDLARSKEAARKYKEQENAKACCANPWLDKPDKVSRVTREWDKLKDEDRGCPQEKATARQPTTHAHHPRTDTTAANARAHQQAQSSRKASDAAHRFRNVGRHVYHLTGIRPNYSAFNCRVIRAHADELRRLRGGGSRIHEYRCNLWCCRSQGKSMLHAGATTSISPAEWRKLSWDGGFWL